VNGQQETTVQLPLVEVYETVEGEGLMAGYPTIFVRLFGCQLRCSWCDTPYSYAPAQAEETATIEELVERISRFASRRICLTGGEPLIHGDSVITLMNRLSQDEKWLDIHVETNGAVDLEPFLMGVPSQRVRYVMDYKLSGSGEREKMIDRNLTRLRSTDEIKFVIANDTDYEEALQVIRQHEIAAQILFSPVFGAMEPAELASRMLRDQLSHIRLNVQLHKLIWPPAQRGV
jgi:7-carboxy-7-deazaguanine synthase